MRKLFFCLSFFLIQFTFGGNLISNGDFELGNTSWWNLSGSNQTTAVDNTGSMGGIYASKISISSSGSLTSSGFYQYLSVPKGITYTVTFKARASATCSLQNVLTQSFNSTNGSVDGFNWLAYSNTYGLTTINQTFTWEFTLPVNTTTSTGPVSGLCKFIFYYGSAPAGTVIYIDDVVVAEKNPPANTNLCNGDFENTMSNAMFTPTGYSYNGSTSGTSTSAQNSLYFGWTLLKNSSSTAAATVGTESSMPLSGAKSIKITSTGTATNITADTQFDWLFGAVKGKTYMVSFKAKSSSPFNLPVSLTSWGSTSYIPEQTCALTSTVQSFTITATVPFDATDNRGVLRFLFGTLPAGVSIWLDDIVLAYQNPVTGIAADASMGIVSGSGTYDVGSTANLTATPYVGFTFSNWTENGSVVSNNPTYSFQIGSGRNLVANFTKDDNYVKTVPSVIAPSDSELINAGRGFYRWNGNEVAPYPSIDRYARYNWTVFETTQGTYDFSILKNEAAAAAADPDGKGTFSFAVRCVVEGTDHAYPAYLDSKMSAWYSNNKKCWVPDWNNAFFLERVDSLVANLGRTFNNDPRIGYIEIRTYGNWGEWHLSGFENPVSPATWITDATIRHMIDVYVKAFPNKQLIMMSDNGTGISYAMSITAGICNPIGWRRDSWCNSGFNNVNSVVADRWKVAPVTVEGYGGTGMNFSTGLKQVVDYHVSSVGNGNFGNSSVWTSYSTSVRDSLVLCAKTAGYRYILRGLTTSSNIIPGQPLRILADWSNVGVAPCYRNWNITYKLTPATGNSSGCDFTSVFKLRNLLPTLNMATGADVPVTSDETFTVPSNLEPGTYNFEVLVSDPSGVYNPMNLAIQGKKLSGAYQIKTINVSITSIHSDYLQENIFKLKKSNKNSLELQTSREGVFSFEVYDVVGRCIKNCPRQSINEGSYSLKLNAAGNSIYFLKIYGGNYQQTIRFIL